MSMARTNIDIDEEACRRVMERFNLTTMKDAVNLALRTLAIEPMTLDEWQHKYEWVQSLQLPFVVAESASGQILGFAYVAPWRQKAAYRRTVEDSIYLRPAAIGKRVGTKLLTEIIERSKAAGVKEIVAVISDKGAESSIALHEAFGFKHQGHLAKVGFKFGRWLGTVLMQKSL